MNDPWGSFQNFMSGFQQMRNNPAQYVMQRMNVPQNMANDPDAIIQNMMSNGQLSQAQYNAARQTAQRIQNHPMFKMFINRH